MSLHPSKTGYDEGHKIKVFVGMLGERVLFIVGGNGINVANLGLNQEAPWYMKIELQYYHVAQSLHAQWKESKIACLRAYIYYGNVRSSQDTESA